MLAACAGQKTDRQHVTPQRRKPSPSPRFWLIAGPPSPWDRENNRTKFVRTPRPTRSRVTVAGGRSPGSRVVVFRPPSQECQSLSVAKSARDSPLTVAGAAAALCASRGARTAFPFDPLREPPSIILGRTREPVKHRIVRPFMSAIGTRSELPPRQYSRRDLPGSLGMICGSSRRFGSAQGKKRLLKPLPTDRSLIPLQPSGRPSSHPVD